MASRTYTIGGHTFFAPALPAGLYLVATPIGNLADISLRALQSLAGADLVLCEDTRTSGKLLAHYGISTPTRALHEHNEAAQTGWVVDEVEAGKAVAVISDAGTPLLSDPGFPVVRAAKARGVPVTALPGASALLAALVSAGLPADAFTFVGFPPAKEAARRRRLAALAARPETLVFYESPRRLAVSLEAMAETMGADRDACVARELTKKFETVYRGTLGELARRFADEPVKGEVVILVAGAPDTAADPAEWQPALSQALADAPLKSAVDEIAQRFDLPRRAVYQAALAMRDETDG